MANERGLTTRTKARAAYAAAATLVLVAGSSLPAASGESNRAHAAALYNLVAAPHASFEWLPTFPEPGEQVLLASLSTDPDSPLVGFAWAVAANGEFVSGGPILRTTFSTYAPQTVRLRVTDGNHVSNVATQTIQMSAPPITVLQPFPIVRIDAVVKGDGIVIKTFTVQAGVGTKATVTCRGHGCPTKSASQKLSGKKEVVRVRFRRFERFLRAGVTLQVRVTKPGKVGSYTRLSVRRHRLPGRADTCLAPAGIDPIPCPT